MVTIRCDLCGSEKHKFLFRSRDRLLKIDDALFNIVKCEDCGLVFINPQPTAEELVKYYPASYGAYNEDDGVFKYGFFSRLARKIKRIFINQDDNIKKINNSNEKPINYLDFGCAGGEKMEFVSRAHPSWSIYGLDNSAFACANAEKRGFKIFCGDALTIDLPENFFDVINMSHVVEHLHSPKETLQKVNRMLSPEGRLIIYTPNLDSLAAKIFGSYWFATDCPRHLFLFTTRTLSHMLFEAGFEVEKIEYEKTPKIEIGTIYHLLRKRDKRINPFIWRIFKPVTTVLSFFGKSSTVKITAKKSEY